VAAVTSADFYIIIYSIILWVTLSATNIIAIVDDTPVDTKYGYSKLLNVKVVAALVLDRVTLYIPKLL